MEDLDNVLRIGYRSELYIKHKTLSILRLFSIIYLPLMPSGSMVSIFYEIRCNCYLREGQQIGMVSKKAHGIT